MSEIKISSYRVVEDGGKKPFCVYVIEVRMNSAVYEVEKRYSQFLALHNELKNLCATTYFPPKKVRSLQQRVLEKRKQALECYLQTMVQIHQARSHVLDFLNVPKVDKEQGMKRELRESQASPRLDHHPIFQFTRDFVPSLLRKSNTMDVVVEGVPEKSEVREKFCRRQWKRDRDAANCRESVGAMRAGEREGHGKKFAESARE